ncbi:ROK family protein [Herbiconiux sp. SYSU D00978]|uniref:ROK family protein n=1 Tax=Herbiconiux sp. SYSU D00978 TaxID=2812562 RepID=UPI001A956D20|nr:ROK family transcriptional regulator [Herbiconiux sp. SYSU D00978]
MPRTPTTGSGVVLELIRRGEAKTRSDLIEHLGWSRVTLSRRLDELLAHGLIVRAGQLSSSGGRPPEEFAVNKDAGLILAMDIGGSHTRLGITDLMSNVLREDEADIGLYDGPDDIFEWALQVFDFLLDALDRDRSDVRAIGVGVPGPVDAVTGRLGSPQLDHRWEEVRVDDYFKGFDAVFAVDRDVNILALGETRLSWPEYRDLTVVKVGMGLGCAFVLDGRIYRGSRGGAGQLSAPRSNGQPLQRLEAIASGRIIQSQLEESGVEVRTSADIVRLAREHHPGVLRMLEEIGREIGEALADVAGLLNPQAVIVGGTLAETGERLTAGIRSALLSNTHEFTRRGLVVERARLGDKAGVRGASLLAQDRLFDAERVSALSKAPATPLDTP